MLCLCFVAKYRQCYIVLQLFGHKHRQMWSRNYKNIINKIQRCTHYFPRVVRDPAFKMRRRQFQMQIIFWVKFQTIYYARLLISKLFYKLKLRYQQVYKLSGNEKNCNCRYESEKPFFFYVLASLYFKTQCRHC